MVIIGAHLTVQPNLISLELSIFQRFIDSKNITTNIFRIQAYSSIKCGYLCIWIIDFTLKGKSLLNYTKFFSPKDYEKNDEIILKYFQCLKKLRWKNLLCCLWWV